MVITDVVVLSVFLVSHGVRLDDIGADVVVTVPLTHAKGIATKEPLEGSGLVGLSAYAIHTGITNIRNNQKIGFMIFIT